jgi:alanyl-tRNA synthetase
MRDLVLDACRHGHGAKYHLYAVTVMPDHVHLLLWPRPVDDASPQKGFVDLSQIMHGIKSYTANQIQRRFGWQGPVWQHESFDRIVRDAPEFAEKWDYIAGNAPRKGLSRGAEDYRWFWYSVEEPRPTQAAQAETPAPPSQAGTLAPPSPAGTPGPPSQAGTLAPPSPAGTPGPPSQAGTLAPPSSASTSVPPSRLGGTSVPACDQIQTDIAFRVIADHIRCLSFAVADGIIPSNEGRGYVLRRILRRAIRYGRNLGFHEPFFYRLVEVVVAQFGEVFPELRRRQSVIETTLRAEEEHFNKTLDRGLELFEQVVAQLISTQAGTLVPPESRKRKDADAGGAITGKFKTLVPPESQKREDRVAQASLLATGVFPAEDAFKLYDTYGFPLDLTELMARERGLTVDVAGFEKLMDQQRRRARQDHEKKKATITVVGEGLKVAPTKFLGYENLEAEAVVEAVEPGPDTVEIILDQTPCYAEMGGQVGDTGLVHVPGHEWTEIGRLQVLDTQKQGDAHVHKCRLLPQAETPVPPGTQKGAAVGQASVPVGVWRAPEVGEAVRVAVDAARRADIQRHHTVTHLFHWALHEVVSREARQRGSLVAPDRLRFDFNHPERLTEAQMADIERLVNERIRENAPVFWFELPYHEIKGHPNVMQFFGDKYGDIVRVVQVGGHAGQLDGFSMELCGGTHTKTTGEIGLFKITKESAISAGVRRVEAVCGRFAEEFLEQAKRESELEAARERERQRQKEEGKRKKEESARRAGEIAAELLGRARPPGAPLVAEIPNADAELLRAIVDALKPKLTSGVVVLGGVERGAAVPAVPLSGERKETGETPALLGGKVHLICYVTPDRVKAGQHAGRIVGELAKICGGGGGGKPDLAQAGGKQPEKLAEALAAAERIAG